METPGARAERGGRTLLHALSGEFIGVSWQSLHARARWQAGAAEFKYGSSRLGGGRGGRFPLTDKFKKS